MKLSKRIIYIFIFLIVFIVPNKIKADTESQTYTIEEPTTTVVSNNETYYVITKPEQLEYISETGGEWLEKNYILKNDIVMNDVSISYSADGTLQTDKSSLKKFTPISDFKGKFYGEQFSIKGLYVDCDETGSSGGLFSSIENGHIEYLRITDSYVKADSYAGGLVGKANGGFIFDCQYSGAVIGNGYIGGLVGYATKCTNLQCVYSYGNIFSYSKTSNSTGLNNGIGGIIGCADSTSTSVEMRGCYNYSTVNGFLYAGGIAGWVRNGNLECCYNWGKINGNSELGGISGRLESSSLTDSANSGDINGVSYIGGIVGVTTRMDSFHKGSSLNTVSNKGKITCSYTTCGGITSISAYTSINNVYNIGNVSAKSGSEYVGGLIGRLTRDDENTYSNGYYLKTDTVNSSLNPFGNINKTIEFGESKAETYFCEQQLGLITCHEKDIHHEAINATCVSRGSVEYWICKNCRKYIDSSGDVLSDITVEATGIHTFQDWKITKKSTISKKGKQERTCSCCGFKETKTIPKLKPTIKLSVTKKTLKIGKTFKLKAKKMALGDSIKSFKSSNPKIATVSKKGNVVAKSKGHATITVTLKSGKKAKCKITVK